MLQAFSRVWRRPALSGTILATLAIGVGLNATTFGFAYQSLLRPLPYPEASELVILSSEPATAPVRADEGQGRTARFAFGEVGEWRTRTRVFAGVAGYSVASYAARSGTDMWLAKAGVVTVDFASILRITPLRGRLWLESDKGADVVLVSEQLARTRLGGLDASIGQRVALNDVPYTVVGVLPRSVNLPMATLDLWLPSHAARRIGPADLEERGRCVIVARLRPGMSTSQVADDVRRVSAELSEAWPSDRVDTFAVPLQDELHRPVKRPLLILEAVAVLLLLVGTVNVALVLRSRFLAERRSIAIRMSLGASPRRLLGETVGTMLVLGGYGAVAAVMVTFWSARLLQAWQPAELFAPAAISYDPAVAVTAVILALGCAAMIGVWSGLAVNRLDVRTALAGHVVARAGRRCRWMGSGLEGLLAAQVALAVCGLVVTAAFGARVYRLLAVDAGVDPGNAVVMRVQLPANVYRTPEQQRGVIGAALAGVASVPGASVFGVGTALPPIRAFGQIAINRPSATAGDSRIVLDLVPVSPGYLPALGLRLQAGRFFTEGDTDDSAPVAILSARAARLLEDGRPPVGRTVRVGRLPMAGSPREAEVVGVVEDVYYAGLEVPPDGALYLPLAQFPMPMLFLAIRGTGPTPVDLGAIAARLRNIDPTIIASDVRPLRDVLLEPIERPRFRLVLVLMIASVALGLSAVGVSGLTRHALAERERELAIRAAVGASSRQLMATIAASSVRVLAIGGALGAATSWAAHRAMLGWVEGPTLAVGPAIVGALVLQGLVVAAVALPPMWRWARKEGAAHLLTHQT
ncbi:MAG: ABC transporter permease [Acidobacteria bacterium]|nr:ABC transporter permease [Acidobacteriota bacterium]